MAKNEGKSLIFFSKIIHLKDAKNFRILFFFIQRGAALMEKRRPLNQARSSAYLGRCGCELWSVLAIACGYL